MGNNQQRVSEKIPTLATCIKKKKKMKLDIDNLQVARVIVYIA